MSAAAVVEAPAMYVECVGVGSDGWYGGERAWASGGVHIGGGGEGSCATSCVWCGFHHLPGVLLPGCIGGHLDPPLQKVLSVSLTSSSAGGDIRAKVEASFWRHANRSVYPTFSLIHLPSSSYSDNNEQSTRPTIIQYRTAK